jgi:hypothetical protein
MDGDPINNLREFGVSVQDTDDVVIGWLNLLDAGQIDRFFWDYPGPVGYSPSGYGLGCVTAKRIVARRNILPGGFTSIDQVRSIRGIGPDKTLDMRRQAKEALALATWLMRPYEPAELWKLLSREGPGRPLSMVVDRLNRSSTFIADRCGRNAKVDMQIPFVALALERFNEEPGPCIEHFLRVRVEAWSFAAHRPEDMWLLTIDRRATTCGSEIQVRRLTESG